MHQIEKHVENDMETGFYTRAYRDSYALQLRQGLLKGSPSHFFQYQQFRVSGF